MTKIELREKYKKYRIHLTSSQIHDYSLKISNKLLKMPIWDSSFYHVFLTIESQKEVNTDYILSILSGKDKHTVVSKSDFSSCTMNNFLLTDATTLKLNNYNIPEPIDGIPISNDTIDVVFIPLLAFDKTGQRVGYGKGFYDRFLAQCKPGVIKIGLSFFGAEDKIENMNKNDIKLDYCVTPERIYNFQL